MGNRNPKPASAPPKLSTEREQTTTDVDRPFHTQTSLLNRREETQFIQLQPRMQPHVSVPFNQIDLEDSVSVNDRNFASPTIIRGDHQIIMTSQQNPTSPDLPPSHSPFTPPSQLEEGRHYDFTSATQNLQLHELPRQSSQAPPPCNDAISPLETRNERLTQGGQLQEPPHLNIETSASKATSRPLSSTKKKESWLRWLFWPLIKSLNWAFFPPAFKGWWRINQIGEYIKIDSVREFLQETGKQDSPLAFNLLEIEHFFYPKVVLFLSFLFTAMKAGALWFYQRPGAEEIEGWSRDSLQEEILMVSTAFLVWLAHLGSLFFFKRYGSTRTIQGFSALSMLLFLGQSLLLSSKLTDALDGQSQVRTMMITSVFVSCCLYLSKASSLVHLLLQAILLGVYTCYATGLERLYSSLHFQVAMGWIAVVITVIILSIFVTRMKFVMILSSMFSELIALKQKLQRQQDFYFNQMNRGAILCTFATKETPQHKGRHKITIFQISSELSSVLPELPFQRSPIHKSLRASSSTINVEVERGPLVEDYNLDFFSEQMYTPYLISHMTILRYESRADFKFSIKQIMADHFLEGRHNDRRVFLYFKVVHSNKQKPPQAEQKITNVAGMSKQFIFAKNPFERSPSESEFRTSQNFSSQHRSIRIEPIEEEDESTETVVEGDLVYYEFQLKMVPNFQGLPGQGEHILLKIRDITSIIKNQQKMTDKIYQDAIEANFSHEQMTPLNCIFNNSKILRKKLEELMEKAQAHQSPPSSTDNEETYILLKSIKYSGKILFYYNKSMLTKMKINKEEYVFDITDTTAPDHYFKDVLLPFAVKLKTRKINVHLVRSSSLDGYALRSDWKCLNLALFNVVQNAIKYNSYQGSLIIILKLTKREEQNIDKIPRIKTARSRLVFEDDDFEQGYDLHVEVIDTGLGIEKERQQFLFVPFKELRLNQNIRNLKDNSIGMGLACSETILASLGGTIKLSQSQPGLTVFKLSVPVGVKPVSSEYNPHQILFQFNQSLSTLLLQYLQSNLDMSKCQFYQPDNVEMVDDDNQNLHFREHEDSVSDVFSRYGPSEHVSSFLQLPHVKGNLSSRRNSLAAKEKNKIQFKAKRRQSQGPSTLMGSLSSNLLKKSLMMKKQTGPLKEDAVLRRLKESQVLQSSTLSTIKEGNQMPQRAQDQLSLHMLDSQGRTIQERSKTSSKRSSLFRRKVRNQEEELKVQLPRGEQEFFALQQERAPEICIEELRSTSQSPDPPEAQIERANLAKQRKRTEALKSLFGANSEALQASFEIAEDQVEPQVNIDDIDLMNLSSDRISYKLSLIQQKELSRDESSKTSGIDLPPLKLPAFQFNPPQSASAESSQEAADQPAGTFESVEQRLNLQSKKSQFFQEAAMKGASKASSSSSSLSGIQFQHQQHSSFAGSSFEQLLNGPTPKTTNLETYQFQRFQDPPPGAPSQSSSESQSMQQPSSIRQKSSSRLNEVSQILSNSCMEILQVPTNHLKDAYVGEKPEDLRKPKNEQWGKLRRGDQSNKAKRFDAIIEDDLEDEMSMMQSRLNFNAHSSSKKKEQQVEMLSGRQSLSDGSNNQSPTLPLQLCPILRDVRPALKKTSSLRLNLAPLNRFYEDRHDPSSANVIHRQNNLFDKRPLGIVKINTANSLGNPEEDSPETESVSDSCSSFDIYGNAKEPAPEQQAQDGDAKFINMMMKQSCTSSSVVSKNNILSVQFPSMNRNCECQPRILLVDDNEFNLMPLRILILKMFSIQAELAFNGQTAVDMFKEHFEKGCSCSKRGFIFIFMDIQMPEKDGFEASQEIFDLMASTGEPDLCRIVALTSYTSEEVRNRCLSMGMKDVINKPIHNVDLQRMVYLHYFRMDEAQVSPLLK